MKGDEESGGGGRLLTLLLLAAGLAVAGWLLLGRPPEPPPDRKSSVDLAVAWAEKLGFTGCIAVCSWAPAADNCVLACHPDGGPVTLLELTCVVGDSRRPEGCSLFSSGALAR